MSVVVTMRLLYSFIHSFIFYPYLIAGVSHASSRRLGLGGTFYDSREDKLTTAAAKTRQPMRAMQPFSDSDATFAELVELN